jgi:hypothetical protein
VVGTHDRQIVAIVDALHLLMPPEEEPKEPFGFRRGKKVLTQAARLGQRSQEGRTSARRNPYDGARLTEALRGLLLLKKYRTPLIPLRAIMAKRENFF